MEHKGIIYSNIVTNNQSIGIGCTHLHSPWGLSFLNDEISSMDSLRNDEIDTINKIFKKSNNDVDLLMGTFNFNNKTSYYTNLTKNWTNLFPDIKYDKNY